MASSLPFLSLLLLCSSFSVNAQLYHYRTAAAPTTWTNSPYLLDDMGFSDGSSIRPIILRQNPAGKGLSFAAGFYCFHPCKSFFFSVFIAIMDYNGYQNYYAPSQVIWSANRAHPVNENATLELTSHSDLILRDSDGSLVWSTNVANRSVAGINITESGNLVLFDINNSSIWQSFEHPTDSLVLGQKMAQGKRLTASVSTTNWSESRLYLTFLADGLYGFVDSNPPQMYFHVKTNGNVTGNKSAYMEFMNSSLWIISNVREEFLAMPEAVNVQLLRLESDGHLRLYNFNKDFMVDEFDDFLTHLEDNCLYPTVCGNYGICSNVQQCSCPDEKYFKPVDSRQVNMGCLLVTPITCNDMENHELLTFDNTSYFNYIALDTSFADYIPGIDNETCKQLCLRNCTCKAALFLYGPNSSDGLCYLPSEVFSLKNSQPEVTYYNSSAYLKVQITPSKGKIGSGAMLGFTIGGAVIVLSAIGMFIVWWRRSEEEAEEDFIDLLPRMPTRFTFEKLQMATENFARKLGEGGFGTVFEGCYGDERIAVKRLDNIGHGKKEFLAEVETIGSIHHINLVRLIGFCADKSNRLLVYEYMCNGSLDRWIYGNTGQASLDWPIRYKIITNIAKGLCYLHEECTQRIVHLDIKPANILLDEKFNAKVSDFGLSKLIDRDKSKVVTKMRGTPGYLAPEWLTSMITEKTDVYSFGVVVMEILCGRRNLDHSQTEENVHLITLLEEKFKSSQLSELIDKNLGDVELHKEEIMNVMKLAMWCLQWDSNRRASMLAVVKVLEGAMEVETSLDYNFVSSIPMILNAAGQVNQTTPLLASTLSGPR